MLKRIISAGLALAIAVLSAAAVFAATEKIETITGWNGTVLYYPEDNTDALGVEVLTGEQAKNGNATLHIFGRKDKDNYSANAIQTVDGLEKGASYRLTGNMLVSRDTWRVRLMFNDSAVCQLGKLTNSAGEQITLGKWESIDYTFKYDKDGKQFRLQVAGNGEIYADDLSLKKVIYAEDGTVAGYGEELLVNGDFEADYAAPEEAKQIFTAPRNGANYIAVKTVYPGVAIYDITDGSAKKLELATVSPSDYNCGSAPRYNVNVYAHTGLENDRVYKYLVKTVGSNGVESAGREVIAVPSARYADYIVSNSWSYRNFGNNFGSVSFEQGIGTDGSAAVRISNMSDSSSNNTYIYISNQKKFSLGKDKVYKLSFMAKAGDHNSLADSVGIGMTNAYGSVDGTTFGDVGKNIRPMTSVSGEWQKYTCYFKGGEKAENVFEIKINRHFENLIFDDFELCEAGTAENLFADKNGDFEVIDLPSFKAVHAFYPAYNGEDGENEFGDIMLEEKLKTLSELEDYGTDTVYARVEISNEKYDAGKDFTYIVALYSDNTLSEVKYLKGTAAYRPVGSSGERFGIAMRLPSDAENISLKAFVWDNFGSLMPLTSERCGSIN